MTRKEAIVARRSVRTYTGEPLKDKQLLDLRQFIATVKPLHPSIKMGLNILSRQDFLRQFSAFGAHDSAHYLVIRSVRKEGYLENAGFIGQQIALYLTEQGVGSCWLGNIRPREAEAPGQLPYVICMSFGRPDNSPIRHSPDEAKRKLVHELVMGQISNPCLLDLLNAARLAPSAINLQPVRYMTESTNIYAYRKLPLLNIEKLHLLQSIDVGIALANIYVASDFTRVFVREKHFPTPVGNCIYEYTCLEPDAVQAREEAVYDQDDEADEVELEYSEIENIYNSQNPGGEDTDDGDGESFRVICDDPQDIDEEERD